MHTQYHRGPLDIYIDIMRIRSTPHNIMRTRSTPHIVLGIPHIPHCYHELRVRGRPVILLFTSDNLFLHTLYTSDMCDILYCRYKAYIYKKNKKNKKNKKYACTLNNGYKRVRCSGASLSTSHIYAYVMTADHPIIPCPMICSRSIIHFVSQPLSSMPCIVCALYTTIVSILGFNARI